MSEPQLLLEIGRMDDQEIVTLITQLRQENEQLREYLRLIRDDTMTFNECLKLAHEALDGGKE